MSESDSSEKSRLDNLKGSEGKRFSSENQPTNQQKRDGMLRRKVGRELAKSILEMEFKGAAKSTLKKDAAKYYGVSVKEVSVEMMLLFRQIEKAIQKADTPAFKAIMERSHGMPKQELEVKQIGGAIVIPQNIQNLSFDEIKELIKQGDSESSKD